MGAWEICPVCGAVVADVDLHETWHAPPVEPPAPTEPDPEEEPDGD